MKFTKTLPALAAASFALSLASAAHAGETIELGDGFKLDWRLTSTATVSSRIKDSDPLLSSRATNASGNDGDNNFAKGAATARRLALNLDSKITKGDSGFVFSGSGFYDDVYHRTNSNNPSPSNPGGLNKPAPFNEFTSDARRMHGGYVRALDAYAYTAMDTGGAGRLTVRAGIKNLLNTAPPFSNQAYFFISGYDPSYTDPRGRSYFLHLQYQLK